MKAKPKIIAAARPTSNQNILRVNLLIIARLGGVGEHFLFLPRVADVAVGSWRDFMAGVTVG